jgi:phosphatidylserine/phosphatidylglycerophosphate/cardiolipin synthase-like enzyme
VAIRLVVSSPTESFPDTDIKVSVVQGDFGLSFFFFPSFVNSTFGQMLLAQAPSIDVVYLNMTQLFGSGVMHAKFMIVDNSSFYLGSANFGNRAYIFPCAFIESPANQTGAR